MRMIILLRRKYSPLHLFQSKMFHVFFFSVGDETCQEECHHYQLAFYFTNLTGERPHRLYSNEKGALTEGISLLWLVNF